MSESTGKSLIKTVAGKELCQITGNVSEIAIDVVLSEGFLRDLPVIGTIKGLVDIGLAVKEELFIRKLIKFLIELKSIPLTERQGILKRYPDGSQEQQNLGENILIAIERLDDISKPKILAKFFCAYITNQIDFITFSRLSKILERFNLSLLPYLKWFYLRIGEKVDLSEEIRHELSLAGLITTDLSLSGTLDGGAEYRASDIGSTFLRIGYGLSK